MNNPLLSAHVVTWNSAEVIGDLLASLRRQTLRNVDVVVVDNASTDDTLRVVRDAAPSARVIRHHDNRGFSGGHNAAIRATTSRYVALLNPDLVLTDDALEILVAELERMDDVGSIGGKLLKTDEKSGTIDAAGIAASRRRQFLNRGEGERDHGQYDRSGEVFGLSGAFLVVRRAALENIRFGDEYLDEDFFAYKEDVDLAWRLRAAGWRNWYEHRAVAFHNRRIRHETASGASETDTAAGVRRRRKAPWANNLSYRNHLLLLMKHERWPFLPLPAFAYEMKKFVYLLARERHSLRGFLDALRLLPRMRAKAQAIERTRTTQRAALERWFL